MDSFDPTQPHPLRERLYTIGRLLQHLVLGVYVSGLLLATSYSAVGAEKAADKDTIRLVEYVVTTPTAELQPSAIPAFMKIDPASLPDQMISIRHEGQPKPEKVKLRVAYDAKKDELVALKKIADGRNKPPIRRYGMEEAKCKEPLKGTPEVLRALTLAGFQEATDEEIRIAMQQTKCGECELETEFSLTRVSWRASKKTKKDQIRYFFFRTDPVWLFIDMYKKNLKLTTGTAFFGIGGAPHCH